MNRFIFLFVLTTLSSCQYLPEIAQGIDDLDLGSEPGVRVEIDQSAIKNGSEVNVDVQVNKKDS